MNELLTIRNLTVKFYTYDGVVQALDNLDLDINQKETFGLVGETGCGKTLTALSILRLISPPGRIESGSIYFTADSGDKPIDLLAIGEEEIRAIRGSKISMIFQEPSAALNPVYTIGDQVSEVILLHRRQELVNKAIETVTASLAGRNSFVNILANPIRLAERSLYQKIAQNPHSLWPRIVGRIPLVRRLLQRLKDESDNHVIQAGPKSDGDSHGQYQDRESQEYIGYPHDDFVNYSAEVAGKTTQHDAYSQHRPDYD